MFRAVPPSLAAGFALLALATASWLGGCDAAPPLRPCRAAGDCARWEACRGGFCADVLDTGGRCTATSDCRAGLICVMGEADGDAEAQGACLAAAPADGDAPTEAEEIDITEESDTSNDADTDPDVAPEEEPEPEEEAEPPVDCDDDNVCTHDLWDGTGCVHPPLSGGACDDKNDKTADDRCDAGVCRGTPAEPLKCCGPACDDCTKRGVIHGYYWCEADACVPRCNEGYRLTAGACVEIVCEGRGNPCMFLLPDSTTGQCLAVPRDDGTPCVDFQNKCLGQGACRSGACADQPALDCDDADPCTLDACVPATGCEHGPVLGCPPAPGR